MMGWPGSSIVACGGCFAADRETEDAEASEPASGVRRRLRLVEAEGRMQPPSAWFRTGYEHLILGRV